MFVLNSKLKCFIRLQEQESVIDSEVIRKYTHENYAYEVKENLSENENTEDFVFTINIYFYSGVDFFAS